MPVTKILEKLVFRSVAFNIALTPGSGAVTGTVRNAATGQPLSGAMVTVAGTNISATSGADGGYTLANVPAEVDRLFEVTGVRRIFDIAA